MPASVLNVSIPITSYSQANSETWSKYHALKVCVPFTVSITMKEDWSDCQQEYATVAFGLSQHPYLQYQLAMLWEGQAVSLFHVAENVGKRTFSSVRYTAGGEWGFSINTFTFYLCSSSFTTNFNQAFSLYSQTWSPYIYSFVDHLWMKRDTPFKANNFLLVWSKVKPCLVFILTQHPDICTHLFKSS